jgi:hypothetical protein
MYRAIHLYSHGFVLPNEEQMLRGLSPLRYRCTADIRCFRSFLTMNTSAQGLGVHDKTDCGYFIVKERW